MGSYLSIENNTRDTYLVKVGVDQAALRIAGIVTAVIAAVSTVITAGASLAPLATALKANGVISVLGVSTGALKAITGLAASLSGIPIAATAVGWAQSMVLFITEKLITEDGYVRIRPGQTHVFGRYTLSLWRQGTCIRVRQNPSNPAEVIVDNVFMRPIFSGATANSVQPHNIGYWINKFGHENRTVVERSSESRVLEAAADDEVASDISWLKVAEEVALKLKQTQLSELNGGVSEEEEQQFLATGTVADE